MGTEHVALLLYSLVSMLRPRSVLEIGAGYTTAFLARALADARDEAAADRQQLQAGAPSGGRAQILCAGAVDSYLPHLHVIDDLSYPETSAFAVESAIDRMGVSDIATLIKSDFRGASHRLPASALPLDFVWFDCRAAADGGVSFLNEYWPLLNEAGGVVVFHSMQVPLRKGASARPTMRVPSPLLNELRKRQADAGRGRTFELVSLMEPHKIDQGDVTILTRIGGLERVRNSAFADETARFGGATSGDVIPL